jgi:ankyrin repeat protein
VVLIFIEIIILLYQISVKNGHIDVVKYLIDQGADIHANNEWILYYGISRGHLDIVKFLVEKGVKYSFKI